MGYGAPDERYTSTVSYQEKGYFSDNGYKSYPLDGPSGTENWSAIANGTRDGEPDMFFFNMPGYSGKFFFRDDRTPVFIPQQDIKVEYNYTGTGSIQSFTLTVPDGTAYSFGVTAASGDTDPVEKTDAYSSSTGYVTGTVISSWYLNKIESSDKRFSISLNYTQDNYAFNTLSLYPVANDNKTNSDQNDNYEYKMIRNRINGVRISSITASNMQINFIPGAARTDLSSYTSSNGFLESTGESAGNTLGEIQIADNASNVFKKYLLSYSYFSGSNSLASGIYFSGWSLEKDKTRLKLDKIQEQSMDGSIINPPCEFTYNNPGSVPRRLSFAQDHWGYFNGETGNNTLIPTYSKATDASGLNYQIVNGADREPNWPSMQNGSLKSIILRNGQNSEFLN